MTILDLSYTSPFQEFVCRATIWQKIWKIDVPKDWRDCLLNHLQASFSVIDISSRLVAETISVDSPLEYDNSSPNVTLQSETNRVQKEQQESSQGIEKDIEMIFIAKDLKHGTWLLTYYTKQHKIYVYLCRAFF